MEEKWFWRRSKCHFPITIRTAANFDRWRIGFKDNIVGGRRPAGEWLAPTLNFFPVIDPSPRLPGILRLLSRVSRSSTFICPITIFQLWFRVEQRFYFFHSHHALGHLAPLVYDVQKWDKLVHHVTHAFWIDLGCCQFKSDKNLCAPMHRFKS